MILLGQCLRYCFINGKETSELKRLIKECGYGETSPGDVLIQIKSSQKFIPMLFLFYKLYFQNVELFFDSIISQLIQQKPTLSNPVELRVTYRLIVLAFCDASR